MMTINITVITEDYVVRVPLTNTATLNSIVIVPMPKIQSRNDPTWGNIVNWQPSPHVVIQSNRIPFASMAAFATLDIRK
jgi:hypothetical protein